MKMWHVLQEDGTYKEMTESESNEAHTKHMKKLYPNAKPTKLKCGVCNEIVEDNIFDYESQPVKHIAEKHPDKKYVVWYT